MPIPESYYVNVNINYNQGTVLSGSVPMSVLISQTATSTKVYTNLSEVISDYPSTTAPERLASTIYFNNGGTSLLIYKQTVGTSDEDTIEELLTSYDNFVWITFVEAKTVQEMQAISTTLSASTQQLTKYLAQTTNIANAPTSLSNADCTNIALLYSTEDTLTPYSAISIPAMFSGVNLTLPNSIKSIVHKKVVGVPQNNITTANLSELYAENWNLIINLANKYSIFDGGKMVDGQPIHSAWGFSLFKKDCENVVSDLLLKQLPYEDNSNTVLENSLSRICSYYVTNGLIGTNKTYNLETQSVIYNNVTYTLIENGQILNLGYLIFSIPISNATQTDINNGQIPPVYIYAIINDTIRLVTINGEVSK